ncbi:similar to Saccharomyces cerevisiae YJR111C Putative protein of unknown function [Maudiozyma barnettii]|uniref:Carboxymuconolactone decarboxylase-like domain-containing protein n=1 Tax=Maudiozyma barnettii TaxID=61262 RepID=A0A8H2VG76_9SACH|nr:uncharacterized protein KABA2_05S05874 [Kazachstania barnettii]CAB4254990.1 similar to Saccharomyces cerevisiae YJR111C Putative protein of unknown function [Kazachstania barnettii]CAD1783261.1 similar to Saccharomyces cerevisiae YJR111C Putative protein of unknown function [Kazachstania barnettii]
MPITNERLINLIEFNNKLDPYWAHLAIATVVSCNFPELIPKIYITRLLQLQEANKEKSTQDILLKTETILLHHDELDVTFADVNNAQIKFNSEVKEVILKESALVGIPRAINGLRSLYTTTPKSLLNEKCELLPENTFISKTVNRKDESHNLQRGLEHWNKTYGKVSMRIINDLNDFYPDLWQFIIKDVYSDVLSYGEIIDASLTSLVVICALIPLDVNSQLRGHLRGALNLGWDCDFIEVVRNYSLMISVWCGVHWKTDVVKL